MESKKVVLGLQNGGKKPLKSSNFKVFVGMDVSKKTMDVSVVIFGVVRTYFQVTNNFSGYAQIIRRIKEINEVRKGTVNMLEETLFCVENTGIYHHPVVTFLVGKKHAVWVENAYEIKHSMGMRRSKTDVADSECIATYAYRHQEKCKLFSLPSPTLQKINLLLKMRDKLLNVKDNIIAVIKEYEAMGMEEQAEMMRAGNKATLKGIEADLNRCEKELTKVVKEDEELNQLFKLVTSVEGIGKIIGLHILVETQGFTKYRSARKFACAVGIAPFKRQSGTSLQRGAKVSFFANKNMKKMIHLAAMTAIRSYGGLRGFYERKLGEGKHKMSVINAVRNKLIHRMYAVVNSGVPYDKFHDQQSQQAVAS